MSWASASVAATVAAVERVRAAQSRQAIESCAPRVLIAEGSLGAEAAGCSCGRASLGMRAQSLLCKRHPRGCRLSPGGIFGHHCAYNC